MYKKRFNRFLSLILTAGIVFNTNAVGVLADTNVIVYESQEGDNQQEYISDDYYEDENFASSNDYEEDEDYLYSEEPTESYVESVGDEDTKVNEDERQSIYEGVGYRVLFEVTDKWDSGYNAIIRIDNTGDKNIENWALQLAYKGSINNIWNAKVSNEDKGIYTIKNAEWNQDIVANSGVEFGFSANEEFPGFPTSYELLGTINDVDEARYDVSYKTNSDWGFGFSADMSLTNNSDDTIEDWVIEFDFDREITSIWNARIESHAGNHYVLKNAGYNSNIKPGKKVNFGFLGKNGSSEDVPYNYSVYSYSEKLDILMISDENLEIKDEKYEIPSDFVGFYGELKRASEVNSFTMTVFDKNNELIFSTDLTPSDSWIADDFALIYGVNTVVFKASIGGISDEKKIEVTANENFNYDKLTLDDGDDDNDRLANYFERYFGTDPKLADTDNDGLDDYVELYILGYDPLSKDSDGNGICDADEDPDCDGLSNLEEIKQGSKLLDNDSDNDRLLDGEELDFGTSPVLEDTDSDGITDYDEYIISKNNFSYDSSTNMYTGTFCAKDMICNYDEAVIPTIELTADLEGMLTFGIERIEGNYMLNPNMIGYMGAAYDFHTDGNMGEAKLTFTYNESLIDRNMVSSEDFCPTIYYYDEETQIISEVEGQTWSGNEVSVVLPHFSTYILINKADMEAFWNETMSVSGNEIAVGNDVVFVIDKSGSMRSNDSSNIRASLIHEFCSRLASTDRVGLVGFSTDATTYTSSLTNSQSELNAAINAFKSDPDYGNTYMNKGVFAAVDLLDKDSSSNTQKSIFCLTDGYTSDTLSATYLSELKTKGIKIYTVGLGTVSTSYLQRVASSTDGKYFYARTSADLSEVFIDFGDELVADANNDGLDDELTKLICQGILTTQTGTRVFCGEQNESTWEENYNAVMENADYDGDGLLNGEEIEIFEVSGRPYIALHSSPELMDSDFDMYSDYEEVKEYGTNPLTVQYIVNSRERLSVSQYANFESGDAFDDYLDRSDFVIVSEYIFNAIICGGEGNVNKRARKQLLEMLVSYAEDNCDAIELSTYANYTNAFLRGFLDIVPGLGLQAERIYVTKQVNAIQVAMKATRCQPYSKLKRQAMLKEIKGLENTLGKYSDKAKKINKYGAYATFAITAIACAFQSIEEFYEYSAALKIVSEYDYILAELMYCGDDNIEYAAQTVYNDMSSVRSKYGTGAYDTLNNVGMYGSTAAASYLLAGLGPWGLVADLVWLAADIAIGDRIENKIINFINVECANATTMASSNQMNSATYKSGLDGNVYVITSGDTQSQKVREIFIVSIFARKWAEEQYMDMYGYSSTASSNISMLQGLYEKY